MNILLSNLKGGGGCGNECYLELRKNFDVMYALVASGCNRNVAFNAQLKVKVIGWQILAGTLNLASHILGREQFCTAGNSATFEETPRKNYTVLRTL